MGKDRIGSSNDIVWCWFGKVIVNYTWGVTFSCRPFLICVYWHLPNALIRHACTECSVANRSAPANKYIQDT